MARSLGASVVGAILLLGTFGCGGATNGQQPNVTPAKTTATGAVAQQKSPAHRTIELPGTLEAFEETPLQPRVAGYVAKVHVDSGDAIKGPRWSEGKLLSSGQILAEQAIPDSDEELKQKEALVALAKAEVDQSAAALEAADAYVQTAKAQVSEAEAGRSRAQALYDRWQAQFKQDEKLVEGKTLDPQSLEVTRNQFKAAEAAREEIEARVFSAKATARESEAKRNKAKADVEAARARVRVAQAEEGRQAALVAYAKIRAPFDGVVVRRNVHTGHFVQPGGAAAAPLFVVARVDQVRIIVEAPEADALLLPPGTLAKVRIPSLKDRVFEGKVNRTSWALETKSRTLRVQVDLANPEGILRPGMYAYVAFTVEPSSK